MGEGMSWRVIEPMLLLVVCIVSRLLISWLLVAYLELPVWVLAGLIWADISQDLARTRRRA